MTVISCPTSLPCPVSQERKGKGVTHSWGEDAASPGGREGEAAVARNHLAEEDFTRGWEVGDGESEGKEAKAVSTWTKGRKAKGSGTHLTAFLNPKDNRTPLAETSGYTRGVLGPSIFSRSRR